MHPYDIIFVGLVMDVAGAVILAKGFMFKSPQVAYFEALMIAGSNPHFFKSALLQRVEAQIGAAFLVIGFLLQIWGNLHGGIAASEAGWIDSVEKVLLVAAVTAAAAAMALYFVSRRARQEFYRLFFRSYKPNQNLAPPDNDATWYDRLSMILDLKRRSGESDNQFLERVRQRYAALGTRYGGKTVGNTAAQ